MNQDRPNANPKPKADDPLDRLLQQARWPEAEPERIERLWRVWPTRRLNPIRSIWPKIAAAAAILFVTFTASLVWRWHGHTDEIVQCPPEGVEQTPGESWTPERLIDVRPATAYEQVLVLTAERRSQTKSDVSATVEEPDLLLQTIERLATDSEAKLTKLAEELLKSNRLSAVQLERGLAERIRSETGPRRWAAIRLLAHVGTSRSLPLLLELNAWPPTHAVAVPGVARLADAMTLARLAMAEADPRLQKELLAALLERGGHQGVTLFLNFVQDRRTTQAALDSLDAVTEPPVEPLFQMLNSSNYPLRIAAARVLGRLDGPVISQRLAQMVVRDVNRREALVALLTCPDVDAVRFLQTAQQYPALAADIRRARSQLQTIQ